MRLEGLAALPPAQAEQLVDFAKRNKARLVAELEDAPTKHDAPGSAPMKGTGHAPTEAGKWPLARRIPDDPAEALGLLLTLLERHPGLYLCFGYAQDHGPAFSLQPGEHPAYSEGFGLFLRAVAAIVPRAGEMRQQFGEPRL